MSGDSAAVHAAAQPWDEVTVYSERQLQDAGHAERGRWASLCTDLMNKLWAYHPAPDTDPGIEELSRRQAELEVPR